MNPFAVLRAPAVYQGALLLACSNVFMTFAWYAHLGNLSDRPWWIAALLSWASHLWAGLCLLGTVYFVFRPRP